MNKAGNLGMHLHQTLSFCSLLARCDRNPAVFWPGCALMSLDPEILGRTLQILRRAEPEIGISTCCCGQPTRYLFPAKSASRQEWIRGILQHQGVERVYTACPNCGSELREWSGVDVVSIWPVLAQYLQSEDVLGPGGYCVLHDPCPLRNSSAELDAVRFLCSRGWRLDYGACFIVEYIRYAVVIGICFIAGNRKKVRSCVNCGYRNFQQGCPW